jgi:DNA-binding LytR/AlgR family response regulator
MKVVIIEDEKLAAKKLITMLAKAEPNAQVVAQLNSIESANQWFKSNEQPDIIFSDVELLDGKVFSVFEQHPPTCPVIFTTAYDDYLKQAFESNGIEYLLKPFDQARLQAALDKYRRLEQQFSSVPASLIAQLQNSLEPPKEEYRKRFTIKRHKTMELVEVKEVAIFRLDQTGLFAHNTLGKYYPMHEFTLNSLETMLCPQHFFRINRNEIINIDFIQLIANHTKDKLKLKLKGLDFDCITSSHRTPVFRKWIESV